MLGFSKFETPKFGQTTPYPYPGIAADRGEPALRAGERRLSPAEIARAANPLTDLLIDGKVVFTGDNKAAIAKLKELAHTVKETCELRVHEEQPK